MRARGAAALAAVVVGFAAPAEAQLDPSGAWRTLHTEHFRVHFRPPHRAAADRAAREAERAWRLLARELMPPRGPVDLALADDADVANGLASVLPSNRITLYLTPPAGDVALQAYDDAVRLVLVHELAHVFHLDRSRGIWGALQRVFGRAPGLFPNAYQPSWVSEGIATYYESRFTTAGRAEGAYHTQLLGAAAAGGEARAPWDALLFSRWPAGYTPYAYGGRFFSRATREAGDSLVPRFVSGTAGQLIPFRVGRPLRRAGGVDLGAAWRRATGAEPGAGADTGRMLVGGLRSAPVPRAAPDGRRIAYLHDDGRGARRLRVADLERPAEGPSHRVNGEVRYDWTGDTLLISQLDFTDRRHLRSDLYRWVPGGTWHRVTRGARLTEPRTGGGRHGVVALGPGTNAAVVDGIRMDVPGTEWGAVVPSRDGRAVAAARHADGRWALVQWRAAAPESVMVLFDAGGVVSTPAWDDAGRLLFVWDGSGLPQVYRRDAGGSLAVVTADPFGARDPAPLADGSLLYASLRAGGWELRRVTPRPAAVAPPLAPAAFDSAPATGGRETGYALWPSLRPHFWLPLYDDAGVAGRYVGALTGGSDAIGRFAWAATALVSGDPVRVGGSFALVSDAWRIPTVDASFTSEWSGVGRTASGVAVSLLEQDAALGVTLVTRRWRTEARLRIAAEVERDALATEPAESLASVCAPCARDLVGGSATVGVAHYVSAPLAISPQDGFAWSVTVRRQEQLGGPDWANEIQSRLALYLHLPVGGFAFPVLAARVSAGAAGGPAAGRFEVGGASGSLAPLVLGPALGTRRTFPVRGYDAAAAVGRRAVSATVELRVPLALVGRSLGHLPVGVDRLSVALFADAGDAWDSGALPRPVRLVSAGGELVGDVTFPYDFPLRTRVGVAVPLADPPAGGSGAARVYAVLGADF